MADRFFTPDLLAVGEFVLTGSEAHHLANVRRFTTGDRVSLFNGDGREYPADVLAVSKKQVVLNVVSVAEPQRELGFRLEIAAAMPKGDRGDFLIEKLTELGVTRFTPLDTARSVVTPKESRIEKLQHAVIEASKQCGRNVLMEVEPVMTWNSLLARKDLPLHRLLLSTGDAPPLSVGQASSQCTK
jgi:16S rRNA (uracil1498-N3)-methyltransferase